MCQWVILPDGGRAIVCGGRHKPRRCALCQRPATLQCDYPAGDGQACDAHLCRLCAVPQGDNVDWCKSHAEPGLLWTFAPRQSA